MLEKIGSYLNAHQKDYRQINYVTSIKLDSVQQRKWLHWSTWRNLINIMSVYKVTYRRFHTGESINIYELLETYKIIPALLGDTYT